jgi:hypothetical protein
MGNNMVDYLKREGDYYLVDNGVGYVWINNDTEENVSPVFEDSDEAEFWMFDEGRHLTVVVDEVKDE